MIRQDQYFSGVMKRKNLLIISQISIHPQWRLMEKYTPQMNIIIKLSRWKGKKIMKLLEILLIH